MNGLLAGAALLPIVAAGGVVLLIRVQKQERALQLRIVGVSRRLHQAPVAAQSSVVRRNTEKPGLLERLAGLICYNLARRDDYKASFFVVLGVASLIGLADQRMSASMIGAWAWVPFPFVVGFLCRMYYAGVERKRRGLLLTQFPDALALIVRAVRVGIPVSESLRGVSREASEPTRGEFDRLQHQIAMGIPLETSLRELAARNGLAEYGFFAAVLALQAQTGGGLTDTLEMLADIIRRRIAMKERGHALSSEARTSTYVLGGLPVFSGAMLYFASPDYISVLFSEPLGHAMLGVAALSLATGIGIMRLIIRKTLT